MLVELRIETKSPIEVLCDNQFAIAIAKNRVHHDSTKHMEIDRHIISEKIETKVINLRYVPSQQQTTDILTKTLLHPNFYKLNLKLGRTIIYHPA